MARTEREEPIYLCLKQPPNANWLPYNTFNSKKLLKDSPPSAVPEGVPYTVFNNFCYTDATQIHVKTISNKRNPSTLPAKPPCYPKYAGKNSNRPKYAEKYPNHPKYAGKSLYRPKYAWKYSYHPKTYETQSTIPK